MAVAAIKRFEGSNLRITLIAAALLLAFSVLGVRLWYLQIVHGEYYRAKADDQRLYPQRLQAPRGLIKDRKGNVLADTRPAFDLVIVPKECPEELRPQVCARLERLLDIDGEKLMAEMEKNRRTPFTQITVKSDVPKSKLAMVQEESLHLPGILTVVRPQRRYSGKTGGQILGYLSEVGPAKLKAERELAQKEDRPPRYRMGDFIGQTGLEKMYDDYLRGKDGQMVVSVYSSRGPQFRTNEFGVPEIAFDGLGRKLQEERQHRVEPTAGQALHITLDMGLQELCERLLAERVSRVYDEHGNKAVVPCRGAIVVLEANTGAVLALASTPSYDPSVFVTSGRDEERLAALELERVKDEKTGKVKIQPIPRERRLDPMKNRCYEKHYPPGSTFKVMMACAALEEGIIAEGTTFGCGGRFTRGNNTWRCWTHDRGGHGGVNVVAALSRSCDVFFYQVGLKLGERKLKDWSTRMGLGVKTGLDLPGELPGQIDDPDEYIARMKKEHPNEKWYHKWYDWQTVNMSIGQSLTVTPLQNAVMMACVVNGGYRVTPYVNADLEKQGVMPKLSEKILSDETLRIVRQGLQECVEDNVFPSGTGTAARVEGLVVLGKTGTAQVASTKITDRYGKQERRIPYKFRDHGLFVAGVLHPEKPIAISIIIEHGLHGSSGAAPLAADILHYFYDIPWTEKQLKARQKYADEFI
jgi:penicillin-binding protein 2